MNSSELRQKFLDFFEKNGHKIVPSSSLLPSDPSVLFTTAGMQQFKPYYLGEKSPWGPNVASVQKCIRTSDIDEVGDESHLTFFEMLGNFSFGGYFKEEAIKLAWEFLTQELKISTDRIYVTVHESTPLGLDKESYKVWHKIIGLPKEKIKTGGIDDNFWGPTGSEGPCGPTTEIYVDGVEVWNIVFNESFSTTSREVAYKAGWYLKNLDIKGVDTGMGLERLAMVVQKKKTIFETDLFKPILDFIPQDMLEKDRRIYVDHARAVAFLISDGVRPSKEGGGSVLRRLMRVLMQKKYENIEYKKVFNTIIKIYE
ncbi:MAG: alanine--tRNA ligase-related protein [Candidatus Parcubacteria bacterium]|nr:alanine--tRNA ligase-related protein [Candidatus Parcubacteria bacterium]